MKKSFNIQRLRISLPCLSMEEVAKSPCWLLYFLISFLLQKVKKAEHLTVLVKEKLKNLKLLCVCLFFFPRTKIERRGKLLCVKFTFSPLELRVSRWLSFQLEIERSVV